ncbi:uncharacterized protein PITG_15588 [Phytophthora infestans T30-4]|uniref:Uncharacterized protein n=1 Tax=Phytophthora infestans (strain T30-4) TaxID=403677 RepID=D0NT46_PHYIT|nr:uncharacterized protein PITG_15588 [Phytophthora infestans T30-4]EEY64802.1 hypothetical protein PITG_15588 [Phytophthora infestans T30-4]|eukprot:XP_002897729.1 hypothetical protein PITG_15588 [Phytophthora infestans T30-4]
MTSSSVFSFSPLQSKSADLSMEGRAQENAQEKLAIAPNGEPDGWPITLDQTRRTMNMIFAADFVCVEVYSRLLSTHS